MFCFLRFHTPAFVFAGILTLSPIGFTAEEQGTTSALPVPRSIVRSSEYRPHVAVIGGLATPEGDYSSSPEIGLDIGFQPFIPFSVGVELAGSNPSDLSGERDLYRRHLMAKATYNFGSGTPAIRHLYAGFGSGVVEEKGESQWASAPLIGFDFPVMRNAVDQAPRLSLGALAKFMIIDGSSPDTLSLNGSVKYWF